MSVRVRFAPSPTGYLHVGGARTALYNWLHARGTGGTFILRIEDTDVARSTEQSLAAILDSMRWLGLTWDEGPGIGGPHAPYFQSQRGDLYREHAGALIGSGRAYRCYCMPEEIEARRAQMAERGEAPRYDGKCRELDSTSRRAFEAEGRPHAIRFALDPAGETAWDDVVRDRIAFRNDVLDDFVIVRSDGWPTYNFACVVDDHLMEISDVIRGDDHISNTPRQLLLYAALGWAPPRFAHVPMILGPTERGSRSAMVRPPPRSTARPGICPRRSTISWRCSAGPTTERPSCSRSTNCARSSGSSASGETRRCSTPRSSIG